MTFRYYTLHRRAESGFTLIELLVVIAIIGLLSSIVLASINVARDKARVSKAKAELNQLRISIENLLLDTNLHPEHTTLSPCRQDVEVYLNLCSAGVQCTDGGYSGWSGPYMSVVPRDPWGTYYYFDPDYQCTDQVGCEGVVSGTWTRAILSYGPNKTEN